MDNTLDARALWRRAREVNAPLAWMGLLSLFGTAVAGALVWLDPRLILGTAGWIKPTKFFISSAIYAATLLWFAQQLLPARAALVRRVLTLSAYVQGVELVLIVLQAARGTRSH